MKQKIKINVLGSCISRVSLLDGVQSEHGIADDRLELGYFLDKQNIVAAMMPPASVSYTHLTLPTIRLV
mgnify:CR=1 FL=1